MEHETEGGAAVAKRSPLNLVGDGYLGDLVAWRFARGNEPFKAKRSEVRAVFEDHGFASCLDDRRADPVQAMAEAARSTRTGARVKILELARPNKDTPTAFGVYFREKGEGEGGDDWQCGARVRCEKHAGVDLIVALPPEGKIEIKQCMTAAAEMAKRANEHLSYTFANELSEAIIAAGERCYWASFRQAGGVYWIHASRAQRIRKLLDALEQLGGFWATLQPLYGDDEGRTMRNVGMAAELSLEAELEELAADLKKAEEKGMRPATLEAREVRCQEMAIRVSLYRDVLAGKTAAITQRLDAVRARFGKLLNVSKNDSAFDDLDKAFA